MKWTWGDINVCISLALSLASDSYESQTRASGWNRLIQDLEFLGPRCFEGSGNGVRTHTELVVCGLHRGGDQAEGRMSDEGRSYMIT